MEFTQQRRRGYTGARLELIKKAASLTLEGATIPEVAKELRVSQSTVRRVLVASEGLPTSCLSETAKVGRLLDLDRCDKLLRHFFPIATGRRSSADEQRDSADKTSFRESLEATRVVLGVIKERAKLFRYQDVPVINQRKLQAKLEQLLRGTD